MIPIDEIRLLHQHGDEWHEMRPAHHAPADHDIERQLTKGVRLFQCTRCDMEFRVLNAEDAETDEEE